MMFYYKKATTAITTTLGHKLPLFTIIKPLFLLFLVLTKELNEVEVVVDLGTHQWREVSPVWFIRGHSSTQKHMHTLLGANRTRLTKEQN